MTNYNIVIIGAVDLPEGGGETTRLKTLCYALKDSGNSVRLLMENTSGNLDQNLLQVKGEVNGIPFEYILGNTQPLSGINFFTAKARAIRLFKKRLDELHNTQTIDVIWFNMLAAHIIYPLSQWAKKRNIKIIHSYEDERIRGRGLVRKLIYFNQWLADKYLTQMADAVVVISSYLKEKYTRLTKGKIPVIIIPTVVEPEKWFTQPKPDSNEKTLLYYGSFYGFDEIEKMIDAVEILHKKGVKIVLLLAGYNRKKPEYMDFISRCIKSKKLENVVQLKGFTPHDKLMDFISQSDILIGLRKDDPWSSTGLSTKLSEYLSTGKPVIVSALGDNLLYLEDNKNAILINSGATATEVAEGIEKLVNNSHLRNTIGLEGRKTAIEYFGTKVVSKKLKDMLDSLFGKN